ncbi:hypothetical protein QE152_g12613 [Popillia japonica]|uniref:Transposable element P transposase-like GTP-binding insertion domain-containing protein n=1 Tax=Popillia japonica TaxID=7064 RepID=A0AAW1LQL7_POPJA
MLIPIATVCDQSAINMKVINSLIGDTKANYLRNGEEYKGNFFEVAGNQDGKTKLAKWAHLVKLYELNNTYLRALPQLTDSHIIPNKIKKMKVKCASQVFSERVAGIMKLISNTCSTAICEEGTSDTDFLHFIDRLLDSVNGHKLRAESGKDLRCVIKEGLPHLNF